jgi:hypothetical protein
MAVAPAQQPDDNSALPGSLVSGTDAPNAFSGPRDRGTPDPTNLAGQYPPGGWGNAIFGGPLPDGTGAPGSQGAKYDNATTDPTDQPGQLDEGLSGLGAADTADTGAPGTATSPVSAAGGTVVSYTQPGSYSSGTYQSEAVRTDLSGPTDSTQANDEGYATGGPKLPGMFEPAAGGGPSSYQPSGGNDSGHVLRGGRAVRP